MAIKVSASAQGLTIESVKPVKPTSLSGSNFFTSIDELVTPIDLQTRAKRGAFRDITKPDPQDRLQTGNQILLSPMPQQDWLQRIVDASLIIGLTVIGISYLT